MVKNTKNKNVKSAVRLNKFSLIVVIILFVIGSVGFVGWKEWQANSLRAKAFSYTNWTTLGGGLNWSALACKVALPSGLYSVTIKLTKNTNDFYVVLSGSNGLRMELRAASLVRQYTLGGNVRIWASIGYGGPPFSIYELRPCY